MVKMIKKAKLQKEKIMTAFAVTYMTAICCIMEAHADIWDEIKGAIGTVEAGILGIATSVATIAAIICLMMMLISGERTASKWFGYLKRIAATYVAILLIDTIIAFLGTLGE